MTRYTNLTRKRTYVQAGFGAEQSAAGCSSTPTISEHEDAAIEPVKRKKRKRSKRKTIQDGESGTKAEAGTGADEPTIGESNRPERKEDLGEKQANGWNRDKGIALRAAASEQRRLKRIREKNQNTTCFACREKGHAARDCPKTLEETNVALDGEGDGEGEVSTGKDGKKARAMAVREAVGTCYRCGSARHSLSRCRKPENRDNPLPFASCFVCSRTGHLAASCPKNAARGVYPNGGACVLCGEKTHLARNCALRREVQNPSTVLLSSVPPQTAAAASPTADEDDFHTFRRVSAQADREEKLEIRAKKREGASTGVGAVSKKAVRISDAVGAGPTMQKAKKVVFF